MQRVNVVFTLRDVAHGECDSMMMCASSHVIPLSWLMDCKFIHSFIHSFIHVWFVLLTAYHVSLRSRGFNQIE